ncbi:hypothetical protein CRG98_027134 [Punica granatum]|uniref:Uncharacterized protein n=1 Tax=Punica granatum TaxID=22663 RepID=A0A2I0J877_PUNGR|nr:hypothetical protein CRG98_027134 [Punica granatum]
MALTDQFPCSPHHCPPLTLFPLRFLPNLRTNTLSFPISQLPYTLDISVTTPTSALSFFFPLRPVHPFRAGSTTLSPTRPSSSSFHPTAFPVLELPCFFRPLSYCADSPSVPSSFSSHFVGRRCCWMLVELTRADNRTLESSIAVSRWIVTSYRHYHGLETLPPNCSRHRGSFRSCPAATFTSSGLFRATVIAVQAFWSCGRL